MTYKWDNKKPTAQMLGRWQPVHFRSPSSLIFALIFVAEIF